jgi:protein-S-isoprenylcysteine O-methyltransferase Ste14
VRYLETKIPAPVVAAAAGACMKFYALAAGIVVDPSTLRMDLGIAIAQVSGAIALAAFVCFRRARTTINPMDPAKASHLVTGGIYRISRNPFYLSLLLLLVAYAVRIDSAAAWLGPAFFLAYVTRFQIQPEERVLVAKFGDAYLRYQARTRRWI